MNIRDSSGVPLSDYRFVTGEVGLHRPGSSFWTILLTVEFAGYLLLAMTAIWLIGYVLSFAWLDPFARALTGVADAVTAQVSMPLLVVTAATIGAFIAGWFVVRGWPARAAAQTAAMLLVAVAGPIFLAGPLAAILAPDGVVAQGRDVGLTVAAGLNGDSNPQPSRLVAAVQAELADNFVRKPLQVWNFGHVLDDRDACRAAWSSGIGAPEPTGMLEDIRDCGDTAAYHAVTTIGAGQVGIGLTLLSFCVVLLGFSMYLAIRIIGAALDAVYHGFMGIFGFVAGGFIYGPTQTYLIRNLVDIGMAAARVLVFTTYLGVYVLFLGNLFRQAGGQVMAVLAIASVVQLVAIWQVRALRRGLDRGTYWIANRIALTAQGGSSSGGGSTALGMGTAGAANALPSGFGLLAGLAAVTTISSSPATAWLAGRVMNPLAPRSIARQHAELTAMESAPLTLQRMQWLQANRDTWERAARWRAAQAGGVDTPMSVGHVMDILIDSGVPKRELNGALTAVGAHPVDMLHADRAMAVQDTTMSQSPYRTTRQQQALAAWESVLNHPLGPERELREHLAFAARAHIAAHKLARDMPSPKGANWLGNSMVDHDFVHDIRQNWDSSDALRAAVGPDRWRAANSETRLRLGAELAADLRAATERYYQQPNTGNLALADRTARRIARLASASPEGAAGLWER